ncbi:MAG: PEP-CTERM sorting domain-containing protein [Limisphaerales bacterium]
MSYRFNTAKFLAACAASLGASAAVQATVFSTTFFDYNGGDDDPPPNVQVGTGANQVSAVINRFSGPTDVDGEQWEDVVGDSWNGTQNAGFETYRIGVSYDDVTGNASFEIFTNIKETGFNTTFLTSDFFIDLNNDSNWDIGIVLAQSGIRAGTVDLEKDDVFRITNQTTGIDTATDLFGLSGSTGHAGRYRTTNSGSGLEVPTMLNDDGATELGFNVLVTWTENNAGTPNNATPKNKVTFTVPNLPGLATSLGVTLDPNAKFLWGTANCGNDVVIGRVVVPEPSTYAVGAGLIGFAAWSLRRRFARR